MKAFVHGSVDGGFVRQGTIGVTVIEAGNFRLLLSRIRAVKFGNLFNGKPIGFPYKCQIYYTDKIYGEPDAVYVVWPDYLYKV